MKKPICFLLLLVLLSKNAATAQTDSDETLQWVENQAGRLDSLLHDAIRGHDQVNIIFRLMDAYLIFDAVAIAGVYCPEVREAALAGRNQADVLNYRLEKDMNSNVLRAMLARIQAEKMKNAALACRNNVLKKPGEAFSPMDIIREDAVIIEIDISDGLAANDFHILSQKLEHAIRVLHDIQHLSSTLQNCVGVFEKAERAIRFCETALAAKNWTQVKSATEAASAEVKVLSSLACE